MTKAPALEESAMICDRSGEIAETFMTEKHGELCEACRRFVEEQEQTQRPCGRQKATGQDG
ncbi:MAG: hypothetical protein ACREIH_05995 [Nitrospiraceae bacterium]